jgi:hypothetical protein
MKIKNYGAGKMITLSTALDTRAKVLNLFYFICFFATGTLFLRLCLPALDSVAVVIIACIAVSLAYIAAYRFANKAVMSEKMFITRERIELIKKGLLGSKRQSFDITKVSGFRHLAKPELSKHPLSGASFDYLGFETQQQVINEMYGDNRVAFDYNGRTINFGQNIYSWDFDELTVLLYDITGKDLRYEDAVESDTRSEE